MKDIIIEPFSETSRKELYNFKLGKDQENYTNPPKKVLDDSIKNPNSLAFIAKNETSNIIGFFTLDKHYQHPGFPTKYNAAYVRSLSIDEKYQGFGYGKKLALMIPNIAKKYLDDITTLFLVVDFENKVALTLYEETGFIHIASKPEGPIGEERLYHLDLGNYFNNNLKLFIDNCDKKQFIVIIYNSKQLEIGHIIGEIESQSFYMKCIFIKKEHRNRGVAISSLRKLAPFLRRNVNVNELRVTISKIAKFNSLLTKSGFCKWSYDDEDICYWRYIK